MYKTQPILELILYSLQQILLSLRFFLNDKEIHFYVNF